jgi:NNP family nitrate/nitrite transporter-like MFS transporter
MFAPFILFYFWAARYERYPQEHGLLGRAPADLSSAPKPS